MGDSNIFILTSVNLLQDTSLVMQYNFLWYFKQTFWTFNHKTLATISWSSFFTFKYSVSHTNLLCNMEKGLYFPEMRTIQSEADHSSSFGAVVRNGRTLSSRALMWHYKRKLQCIKSEHWKNVIFTDFNKK